MSDQGPLQVQDHTRMAAVALGGAEVRLTARVSADSSVIVPRRTLTFLGQQSLS